MKSNIIEIINKYPKHFVQILQSKKYLDEKEWILTNSKIQSDYFIEHLRSVLYEDSNICEFGNIRHLKSLKEGWRFCAHSSKCKCSMENQKSKILEYQSTDKNKQRKQKIQNTNIKKYGSISPFGNKDIREKSKNTLIEKYGEENYFATKEFQENLLHINIKKYGVSSFKKTHIPQETLSILDNKLNFIKFATDKSIGEMSNLLNVDNTTVVSRIKKYECESIISSRSSFEADLKKFLYEEDIKYIVNSRKVISPFELDFFIPEKNIAIECNGDYWHSDIFKNKNYHYEKWKMCNDLGIQLIQIRESDWKLNANLFKSIIYQSLKIDNTPVIGARKCYIKQIDAKPARHFLEKNHLQGFCAGTSHFGGFDNNNNLVSVMTFGWTRGSKADRRFELKRWATNKNAKYPGLFTKTFKYAQSLLDFQQIVSFSMNDWFTGNVYYKAGFQQGQTFGPSYYYLIDNKWRHCSALTKQRIKINYSENTIIQEMLDSGATEFDLTNYLNILRYWDSGKIEWVWKNQLT
jgi:hypothetical protein